MSIIALKWAYTQKLGNPTAKSILAFLASHNFAGDQSCFKVKTIAAATDLTIRSVQGGLKFLHERGLVKKEARYAEHGGQLSNEYTLNIPKTEIDDWYNSYGEPPVDNIGGGVHLVQGGGASPAGGGVQQMHPLNNNINNNNINKSFYNKDEQKENKAVDNSRKQENEKKHEFADSMNQMANEKRHIEENEQRKRTGFPKELREKLNRIKRIRTAHETTELPAGTQVQPEIPLRSEPNEQGATIDARGCKDSPSRVRGSNGLLAARRVYSFLEEVGLAGQERTHYHPRE